LGSYLTEEEVALVKRDLDRMRKVIDSNEPESIALALESLERSSGRIAELMYQDVG
jgi:hypothetical protein